MRWVYPRLALVRGELAVVFFLLLLANTLSGRGLPVQLLPVMTGAYYYATPENNWRELVQPFLPDWPLPQGDEAIRRFLRGRTRRGHSLGCMGGAIMLVGHFRVGALFGDGLPDGHRQAPMG